MTIATASPETLAAELDRWVPASGDIGYLCLLSGTGFTTTVTVSGSTFTTASTHPWVDGHRIRLSSTAQIPAPLTVGTDYYVIRLSGTTFQLATTLANAIAGTEITLNDAGSGTITSTEQALSAADPIEVLVSRELDHASYTRKLVTGVGAGVAGSTAAEKTAIVTYSVTGTAMSYKHVLFVRGGSSTIGDTTGTEPRLTTEPATVTIAAGSSKTLGVTFRAKNA